MQLDLSVLEYVQKWFRVLAIVIVHHYLARQLLCLGVLNEGLGLFDHPCFVRLVSGLRYEHSACFDVQKHKDKYISQSSLGYNFLGEEITLPHCFGMRLEELVPSSWAALWTCVISIPFEDCFDSVSGYRLDAQFSHLAENSGVAPAVVACQFQDQLFDLLFSSRSPRFVRFLFLGFLGCLLSYPAADRRWVHDGR